MVTCPYAIRGTRFVRLRLGDDNTLLRNRMVAQPADLSPVDYISRRTKTRAASTGSLVRRRHQSGDVTFPTFTMGQLMPHSFPRTQVVCPSPFVYPIELGRGEAFQGCMDSSSPMPRGSFDPGPRGPFMVASSDSSAFRSYVPATLPEVASSQLYGQARRHGGDEVQSLGPPPTPSSSMRACGVPNAKG